MDFVKDRDVEYCKFLNLFFQEVIKLKHDQDDDGLFTLLGGTCFDFHKSTPTLFIAGSEEGRLFKCSKEYSSQPLMTFDVQISIYFRD